jgi:hypothetical protein
MARLKTRFLLAATLALSSGGLFLAAAAPSAGAAAPTAAGRRSKLTVRSYGSGRSHQPCRAARTG